MPLGVHGLCHRAAADQEELEELLEGGHGSPASTGEESPHQRGSKHECRKHAAGDTTRQGKEEGSSL